MVQASINPNPVIGQNIGWDVVEQTAPHSSRSERYKFISTHDVVTGLQRKGWAVTSVYKSRVIKADRDGYQNHIVRFAPPREFREIMALGGREATLQFFNSHIGGRSASISFAIQEYICANGLQRASETDELRLKHLLTQRDNLLPTMSDFIERIPDIMANIKDEVEKYQSTILSDAHVQGFKRSALALAGFSEQTFEAGQAVPQTRVIPYEYDRTQLLYNSRPEQRGNSLWNVFNTLQEKLCKGGIPVYGSTFKRYYTRGTKPRTPADWMLNRKLWQLMSDTYNNVTAN